MVRGQNCVKAALNSSALSLAAQIALATAAVAAGKRFVAWFIRQSRLFDHFGGVSTPACGFGGRTPHLGVLTPPALGTRRTWGC